MTFFEAVEAARGAKGWMKKTLCERAGVRPSTYAAWEKGVNPPPLDAVERLAAAAGVRMHRPGEWEVLDAEFIVGRGARDTTSGACESHVS